MRGRRADVAWSLLLARSAVDHPLVRLRVAREAGREPYDRGLSDIVGELSTRSELFRTRWAAHNVRSHDTGDKRFHHPVVGELSLTYETMSFIADSGLTLFVYTAEAGSKSEQALSLLSSWAVTDDQAASIAPDQAR